MEDCGSIVVVECTYYEKVFVHYIIGDHCICLLKNIPKHVVFNYKSMIEIFGFNGYVGDDCAHNYKIWRHVEGFYNKLIEENNQNKIKVEGCNKTIEELETLLGNQGYEIMKLHNEINNTKDDNIMEQSIFTDDFSKKSPEYLSKLNEGNIKVIQQKNEKIKERLASKPQF